MQNNLKQLINLIEENLKIEEVISNYVSLEKKGNNYIGLCPFHADTNPSMSVSPQKGIFKCFSCQAGGNIISFVQHFEGINFIETIKKLADMANIDWRKYLFEKEIKINPEKIKMFNLNKEALNFFMYSLINSKEANEYVKKRNIDKNIIEQFQIGWSGKENELFSYLTKKNYTEDQIVKAGLAKIDDNGEIRDFFINRLIFPIHNLDGDIIGFSGRTIKNNEYAKYLNTPETLLFNKGEYLFNYHRAKSPISLKGFVIIVEGFMDVIAYYKIGIFNAVATMGTSFSEKHNFQLSKLTKNYILSFDNDEPGILATIKTGKEALKNKIKVKVSLPKKGKDTDEFLTISNPKDIEKNLLEAEDYISFIINILFSFSKEKPDFEKIREVLLIISTLSDKLEKDYYISKIANFYNIDKDVIINQTKTIRRTQRNEVTMHKESNEEVFLKQKIQDYELELIALLINNKKILDIVIKMHYIFESKQGKYFFKLINNHHNQQDNQQDLDFQKIKKNINDGYYKDIFISLENKKFFSKEDILVEEAIYLINNILRDNKIRLYKKQLLRKIEEEEEPEQIIYYREKLKKLGV